MNTLNWFEYSGGGVAYDPGICFSIYVILHFELTSISITVYKNLAEKRVGLCVQYACCCITNTEDFHRLFIQVFLVDLC